MKETELIRAKGFGIATVAYPFNNLVRCECYRRHASIRIYYVNMFVNKEI